MKVPTRDRGTGLRFDITPLIDIVFNLIIFFLVATHLVKSESQTEVNLPSAVKAQDEEEVLNRLVVTVLPDGQLIVNDKVTELVDVEDKILAGAAENPDDFELRIRGDKDAKSEFIKPLVSACARAGVTRFNIMVLGKSAP